MTRYLDIHDVSRLVRHTGTAPFLAQLVDYLRADFLRWRDFDKAARSAHHSALGVIELMPISDDTLYAFKYVNGHPKNSLLNKPTVMAFGTLAEVDTGFPILLSELTITTALRTAATSALAASVLARPGARSMAVIGNGAQSEFQILAFHALLGIDELRLFDVDPAATDKLMRNLAGVPGLRLRRCASTAAAVRYADIVTTITADKTNATIITADMVEPGMHINAVGGDCPGKTELAAGVLAQGRVFVEFEPQTRVEGDIQQMPAHFPVTELWRVLAGQEQGRVRSDDITVFDSVGFALEDYAALRLLNDLARRHGIGKTLDLVPLPADPKDLYGLIAPAAAATQAGARRADEQAVAA